MDIQPTQIEAALEAYNPFRADLEQIQALTSLVVTSPDDVEAFEEVQEARKGVKKFLARVERVRKELKRDALEYGRAVDREAKEIVSIAAPVKQHLEEQEEIVLAERRRILQEQERERQRVLVARVESLAEFGVHMTTVEVQELTKEEYHRTLKEAQAIWLEKEKEREAKEARREAAERAQREEEARKIREAQAAEAERLRAEREALEAEKAKAREEAALKQQELDRQKAEIEQREREEQAKLEAKRKKQEEKRLELERQARIAAAAPDLEKLQAYAVHLQAVPLPEGMNKDLFGRLLKLRDGFLEGLGSLMKEMSQ